MAAEILGIPGDDGNESRSVNHPRKDTLQHPGLINAPKIFVERRRKSIDDWNMSGEASGWVENGHPVERRTLGHVNPEAFFAAEQHGNRITRQYNAVGHTLSPNAAQLPDNQFEFVPLATAWFVPEGNSNRPRGLETRAEYQYLTVHFDPDSVVVEGVVYDTGAYVRKHLRASYSGSGALQGVDFSPDYDKIWDQKFEDFMTFQIDELIEDVDDQGSTTFIKEPKAMETENFRYEITYIEPPEMSKKPTIDIKGYDKQSGSLTHSATIPASMDIDALKEDRFPSILCRDPLNSSDSLDVNWRATKLEDLNIELT